MQALSQQRFVVGSGVGGGGGGGGGGAGGGGGGGGNGGPGGPGGGGPGGVTGGGGGGGGGPNVPGGGPHMPPTNQLAASDRLSTADRERVYQWILELASPESREHALLELSKKREVVSDLAPMLWHSFGTIAGTLMAQCIEFPSTPAKNWRP